MGLLNLDDFCVAAIYCEDIDKMSKFYQEVLGFKKIKDMSPGMLFKNDQVNLTLYMEKGRFAKSKEEHRLTEVSLCFSNKDGVKKAKETLQGIGVEIYHQYGDFDKGEFVGIHFRDPEGNSLEVAGAP